MQCQAVANVFNFCVKCKPQTSWDCEWVANNHTNMNCNCFGLIISEGIQWLIIMALFYNVSEKHCSSRPYCEVYERDTIIPELIRTAEWQASGLKKKSFLLLITPFQRLVVKETFTRNPDEKALFQQNSTQFIFWYTWTKRFLASGKHKYWDSTIFTSKNNCFSSTFQQMSWAKTKHSWNKEATGIGFHYCHKGKKKEETMISSPDVFPWIMVFSQWICQKKKKKKWK